MVCGNQRNVHANRRGGYNTVGKLVAEFPTEVYDLSLYVIVNVDASALREEVTHMYLFFICKSFIAE